MAKQLRIVQYKRLKNLIIDFEPGINAISGVNGTCKSSILHIISNAYQAVQSDDPRLISVDGLKSVQQLNAQTNEKIEKLTRGDREYNDPAPGLQGIMFEVVYDDGSSLGFRRHNSRKAGRYAVKPRYKDRAAESLPALPVVYLSLARLFPFGEFQDDGQLSKSRTSLPQEYQEELASLYADITGIKASVFTTQRVGAVKNRQEFTTENMGVDSNTISSGEDNVVILLTALVSLRHYFESLSQETADGVCSILLIDEFDATLHPSYQYAMLDIVETYAAKYKIQVVFTTHSLVLLNYMFKKRLNVIYLMDNVTQVGLMPNPDPEKIELFLESKTRTEMLNTRIIPVFTEDEEARTFIQILLDRLAGASHGFARFLCSAHMVEANFGADALKTLFEDRKVRQSSMASICILDGDRKSDRTHNIVALPYEGKSPEWVAFDYAKELADDGGNPFWTTDEVTSEGFTIPNFIREIQPHIESLRKETGEKKRKKAKQLFNKHSVFFDYVLRAWTFDPRNAEHIRAFGEDIEAMYRKTSVYHGIFIPEKESFDTDVFAS